LGVLHHVNVSLDRLAQQPHIEHTQEKSVVKNGSVVRLHWPEIASSLTGDGFFDFYNAEPLLAGFACFNPHAKFCLTRPDEDLFETEVAAPGWEKWRPDRPTSPHWYSAERLQGLIAALITEERRGRPAVTVRAFVSQFAGLSSSAKQRRVCEAAGLKRAWLHDLVRGNDLDRDACQRLLSTMQAAVKPIKPRALGVLGEAHFVSSMECLLAVDPESVRYK